MPTEKPEDNQPEIEESTKEQIKAKPKTSKKDVKAVETLKKDEEVEQLDADEEATEDTKIVKTRTSSSPEIKGSAQAKQSADVVTKATEESEDLEAKDKEKEPAKVKEVGPSLKERINNAIALKYLDTKEAIYSRLPNRPTMPTLPRPPSFQEVKEGIRAKMPAMPQLPKCPEVSQYLPDMPSLPKIPLPEPLDSLRNFLTQLDSEHVSPLIQRLNYLVLFLSLFGMLSWHIEALLIFRPAYIYAPANSELKPAKLLDYPYVWTLLTSVFVETNPVFLATHLLLINYIVIKNKASLESAWRTKDLVVLLCVAGVLSTLSHFACRLALMKLNLQGYLEFQYCSLNLIIMALLLGLKQASAHQQHQVSRESGQINFNNPTLRTEFDSGIPFISGNIVVPYSILP